MTIDSIFNYCNDPHVRLGDSYSHGVLVLSTIGSNDFRTVFVFAFGHFVSIVEI